MIKWIKLEPELEDDVHEFDKDKKGDLFDGFKQAGSPFGPYADDEYHPLKMFNLYMLKTDFRITNTIVSTLSLLDGVEVVRPISRYQVVIGIGELFDDDYVRVKIESFICGTNPDIRDIEAIANESCRKEAASIRQEISEFYPYWAMLVYPNGTIDKIYTHDIEEFTEQFKEMQESQHKSNGKIIRCSNSRSL